MWPWAILAFARSAMVSVTIEKAVDDSIQPMGRAIGTAMRGSLSVDVVGTTTRRIFKE